MTITRSAIQGQVNRLRVFNAALVFMEMHDRAPDPSELADYIPDLTLSAIVDHLRALDGAAGLKFRTVTGRTPTRVRIDKGIDQVRGGWSDAVAVDEFMTDSGARRAGVTRRDVYRGVGA